MVMCQGSIYWNWQRMAINNELGWGHKTCVISREVDTMSDMVINFGEKSEVKV